MPYIGQKPHNKVVTASEITDGIITADKLASDSVTTAKIADNGVTTAKINADAVTDAKVADDVIGTEHLTAGEVDTTALGADAVTEAKIADSAVENEHLNVNVITGQTAETSAADADTVLIHDNSASALRKMTRSNFLSGVGQTNAPYFHARNGSDHSVGYTGNYTKIQLNTEDLDSAGAFDTSNYRWTPQTAGKYFIYGQIFFETTSSSNNYNNLITLGTTIQKNGTIKAHNYVFRGGQQYGIRKRNLGTSIILDMNGSSDYVELFAYSDSHLAGDCNAAADAGGSCFLGGYFLAT